MSCQHGNWAPCKECDAEDALHMKIGELELEIQDLKKAYEFLFKAHSVQQNCLLANTQNLARNIARRCYSEVSQFEVLDDLAGVISQIDNMTFGMERIAQSVPPAAQPVQEFPQMLYAERRTTLVNSLRASKGWTVGYAEAFVDEFAQPVQPCMGCNGNGEVGGLRSDGYESEICPYCKGGGTEQIAQPEQPAKTCSNLAIGTGAIYDFVGYLTTRNEQITLSAFDEAGPAVLAIKAFLEQREIPDFVAPAIFSWHKPVQAVQLKETK